MLLATAGTALLVMVVVTSVRTARRAAALRVLAPAAPLRLPRRRAGAAAPDLDRHRLRVLARSPARTGGRCTPPPLAAVLVYRLGLPLYRTLRHRVVVTRVVEEGPGVVSVHLRGRALHRLPVKAGPVLRLALPRRRRLDAAAHPYSLSARPAPQPAAHHGQGPRRRQPAAGRPSGRAPGSCSKGPYGALTTDRRTRSKVTLLASGIGITPLRALLEELPRGHHAGLPGPPGVRPRAARRARRAGRPPGSPGGLPARAAGPGRGPGCPPTGAT